MIALHLQRHRGISRPGYFASRYNIMPRLMAPADRRCAMGLITTATPMPPGFLPYANRSPREQRVERCSARNESFCFPMPLTLPLAYTARRCLRGFIAMDFSFVIYAMPLRVADDF